MMQVVDTFIIYTAVLILMIFWYNCCGIFSFIIGRRVFLSILIFYFLFRSLSHWIKKLETLKLTVTLLSWFSSTVTLLSGRNMIPAPSNPIPATANQGRECRMNPQDSDLSNNYIQAPQTINIHHIYWLCSPADVSYGPSLQTPVPCGICFVKRYNTCFVGWSRILGDEEMTKGQCACGWDAYVWWMCGVAGDYTNVLPKEEKNQGISFEMVRADTEYKNGPIWSMYYKIKQPGKGGGDQEGPVVEKTGEIVELLRTWL